MGKMISIDIERGQVGVRYLVLRCPCGYEEGPRVDQVARVTGSVLRMVDHTRNCAESRDSEPILSENTTRTIDAR